MQSIKYTTLELARATAAVTAAAAADKSTCSHTPTFHTSFNPHTYPMYIHDRVNYLMY